MLRFIGRLRRCDSGATAVEYGLIAALISLAIVAGIQRTATEMTNMFNYISGTIGSAIDN